jgi:Protein of unknown function (DUF2934)
MSVIKGVTSSPSTMPHQEAIPHEKIAMRAYDKWCKRGCPPGTDKQDWAEAEAELRAEARSKGGMGSMGAMGAGMSPQRR